MLETSIVKSQSGRREQENANWRLDPIGHVHDRLCKARVLPTLSHPHSHLTSMDASTAAAAVAAAAAGNAGSSAPNTSTTEALQTYVSTMIKEHVARTGASPTKETVAQILMQNMDKLKKDGKLTPSQVKQVGSSHTRPIFTDHWDLSYKD